MLLWSVTATAGMPVVATDLASGLTRTNPSTNEYSVCTRKWTKETGSDETLTGKTTSARLYRKTDLEQGAGGSHPDLWTELKACIFQALRKAQTGEAVSIRGSAATVACSSRLRTGAKERRWMMVGPRSCKASR